MRIVVKDLENKPIPGAVVFLIEDRLMRDENGALVTALDCPITKNVFWLDKDTPLQNPLICDSYGVTINFITKESK